MPFEPSRPDLDSIPCRRDGELIPNHDTNLILIIIETDRKDPECDVFVIETLLVAWDVVLGEGSYPIGAVEPAGYEYVEFLVVDRAHDIAYIEGRRAGSEAEGMGQVMAIAAGIDGATDRLGLPWVRGYTKEQVRATIQHRDDRDPPRPPKGSRSTH